MRQRSKIILLFLEIYSPTAATAATRRFRGLEVIRSAAEAGRSVAAAAAAAAATAGAAAGRRVCRAMDPLVCVFLATRASLRPVLSLGLESNSSDQAKQEDLSYAREREEEQGTEKRSGVRSLRKLFL